MSSPAPRRFAPAARTPRGRLQHNFSADARSGFTLLELAIVMFIMGLMITIAMPYVGGYRRAQLRSVARRLAGRASYLYDEAASQKVVLRLVFNLDKQTYSVTRMDPYAQNPEFAPDNSSSGAPVQLPPAVAMRDVTVEDLGTFSAGFVSTQFYPEGYVDATLIHLVDTSGHVMTLAFNPLSGRVLIADGDLTLDRILTQ